MDFDPASVTAFRYAGRRFDSAAGLAEFDFELGPERFTESVQVQPGSDSRALQRLLDLLGAVLGLSYYKAAAPARYLSAIPLTPAATEFLRLAIRDGLAEFAYRNGLPGLLEPELDVPVAVPLPVTTVTGGPLVPIGGGKDSVVSVELLRAAGLNPVQFAINPNAIIRRVADASGLPLVAARRTIDPRLLELNARGALNGHVPVTAINSLIAVAQSLLLGLGPVVMSNESSASDPTLTWNGEPVNHQWSKSLDAERALGAALREQAGLDGAYFSLLRPFSELRIARGYAVLGARYDHAIVSCNRAFRIGASTSGGATPSWCGECDKCRFVFLALAPWMDPDRLVGIIGHDLFADAAQVPGYRALLGLGAHKPFECVGEEAESSVAVTLVSRIPRWAESPVIQGLLAAAPELATGDAALDDHILGTSPALPVPPGYEEARRALG